MFNSTILILRSGIEIAVVIAAVFVVIRLTGRDGLRKAALASAGLSVVAAVAVAYLVLPVLSERRTLDTVAAGLAVIGALILIIVLWRGALRGAADRDTFGNRPQGVPFMAIIAIIAIVPLIVSSAVDPTLVPQKILEQTNTISTDVIWEVASLLLALVPAILIGTALIRLADFSKPVVMALAFTIALSSLGIGKATTVLHKLILSGQIKPTPALFSLLASLLNSADLLFYVLLGSVVVAALFAAMTRIRPGSDETAEINPAQKRLVRARRLAENRWLATLTIAVFCVGGLVFAQSAVGEKTIELSPATPVSADNGFIKLPVAKIKDGDLHRYAYTADNGTTVRFIVVHKGSGVFGSGLDACQNCGAVGYYMNETDEVVCKNCDSLIPRSTVGFPGGCNPLPLANVVKGKTLFIEQQDLESQTGVF